MMAAWQSGKTGAELSMLAFNGGVAGGRWMVMFGSIIFAYTTILGWSYYGERAAEYLFGEKIVTPYRYLWVAFVFIGSVIELKTIITVADIMNALMAIPNLIALLLLSGTIFKLTRASETRHQGRSRRAAAGHAGSGRRVIRSASPRYRSRRAAAAVPCAAVRAHARSSPPCARPRRSA